jgi:hypothetical protein
MKRLCLREAVQMHGQGSEASLQITGGGVFQRV